MKTLHLRKSINWSPLRLALPRVQRIWIIRGFLLIPLAFVCFALSPEARALLPAPTPDGGYTGWNTAEGQNALFSLTTGGFNTAIGGHALYGNTTGTANTAVGAFSLAANISGQWNVAVGQGALRNNTTGQLNSANGYYALYSNTTGYDNTANGHYALFGNTTGYDNTANGDYALVSNTTGADNIAMGGSALQANSTGGSNLAAGDFALGGNTIGSQNIAVGLFAGANIQTGNNNIYIGNVGVTDESSTIRIGGDTGFGFGPQTAAFIAGISGQTASGGVAVYINSDGKLGTLTSSARFKTEIKPMEKASEALLSLRPVTFRYKKNIDPKGAPQFGLVAEEVEKVNPDLVVRDAEGKVFTVRYEAVNAMLLNEFLKEHRKVEELEATASQQQQAIKALSASLKEQATQIQKVSDQLELSKPARRTVGNNQ